jgi:hypothetical protein
MKLHDFLHHRETCPSCQYPLLTKFLPRKQSIKYEDDYIVIVTDMSSIKKNQPDYKVGYSMSLQNNSFHIDFFTKDGVKFDKEIPIHLVEKFRELDRYLAGMYVFYRTCGNCFKYTSSTSPINFDFSSSTFEELELRYESFCLSVPIKDDDKVKIMVLCNFTDKRDPESIVYYWRGNETEARCDKQYSAHAQFLSLPRIPFVSVEETTKRLSGLLTFA